MTTKNIFFILLALSCCSVGCSERKLKITASISSGYTPIFSNNIFIGARDRTVNLIIRNDDDAVWKNVLVELSCCPRSGKGYVVTSQTLTEIPAFNVVNLRFPLSFDAAEPVKVTVLAKNGKSVFERQVIDEDTKKAMLYSEIKSDKPSSYTFGDWVRIF